MYNFATFDPRPQGAVHNDEIFAAAEVYGIEVTVPALAARCVANLDPQHTEGADQAAIEAALDAPLPPDGAMLATIRADLDSVGSMAVLSLRAQGALQRSCVGCPLAVSDNR